MISNILSSILLCHQTIHTEFYYFLLQEIVEHCDLPIVATEDIFIDAKIFNPEAFSVILTLKGINKRMGQWIPSEETGFRGEGNKGFQKVNYYTKQSIAHTFKNNSKQPTFHKFSLQTMPITEVMDFYGTHNCRRRLPPREALVGDFEVDRIQSVFRGVIKIEVHPTDQKPNMDDGTNYIIFNVPKDPVFKKHKSDFIQFLNVLTYYRGVLKSLWNSKLCSYFIFTASRASLQRCTRSCNFPAWTAQSGT